MQTEKCCFSMENHSFIVFFLPHNNSATCMSKQKHYTYNIHYNTCMYVLNRLVFIYENCNIKLISNDRSKKETRKKLR